MDFRLREIAGKAAGTYFIVTDNSATEEIEQTSNLRLLFINSEKGPVNTIVIFQRGNKAGVQQIFGKGLRKHEKQGNYGIKSALRMLDDGPVAIMNLRVFDADLDKVQISGMSADNSLQQVAEVPYQSLFNINGFWTAKGKNLPKLFTEEHLLNFGNIGTGNLSYFVTVAADITSLTAEGDETLARTTLEIEEYPALSPEVILKDTFVDVWIFNNNFSVSSITNQFYGHLFNGTGMISQKDLLELSQIPESGFNRKVTGSVIPYLKNEFDEEISIDVLLNAINPETGLLAYINDDILEKEDFDVLNVNAHDYYDTAGDVANGLLLSYRLQPNSYTVDLDNLTSETIKTMVSRPFVKFEGDIFGDNDAYGNKVVGIFENGIRGGAQIMFEDKDSGDIRFVTVTNLDLHAKETITLPDATFTMNAIADDTVTEEKVTLSITTTLPVGTVYSVMRKLTGDANFVNIGTVASGQPYVDDAVTTGNTYIYTILATNPNYSDFYAPAISYVFGADETTAAAGQTPTTTPTLTEYTPVVYTLSDDLNADEFFRQLRPIENVNELLVPTNMTGYIPRVAQFTNGSSSRQNEILDVMVTDSVIKGLKNFDGVRYLVDGFKSFIEAGYKSQFGALAQELDDCNKFVRCILNEPFIEDLENSLNPLFKDTPTGSLNLTRWLAQGGNPDFTTNFLSKFGAGAEMCFFYGSGEVQGPNLMVQAPAISGNFIAKTFPWDVVANASGYIDNLGAIELNPDDKERLAMEKFRWNPIIKRRDGFTIFGNFTGQKKRSALQEIHNSELLAYIKETLLNMSRDESFKKGTYDEYIRLETAVTSFMESLVQQQAIQPNPVIICNFSNNTAEIQGAKIKLVHIEYFNVNALDKVVFDLNLN